MNAVIESIKLAERLKFVINVREGLGSNLLLGRIMPWLDLFEFFFVRPGKCRDNAVNLFMIASFRVLSNSLFITVIQRHIARVNDIS